MDIEQIRKNVAEVLGEGADVSYITPELLEEAKNAKATSPVAPTPGARWQEEGNTITQTSPGNWKWRSNCNTGPNDWRFWGGNITTVRTVNCANGIIKYRISG